MSLSKKSSKSTKSTSKPKSKSKSNANPAPETPASPAPTPVPTGAAPHEAVAGPVTPTVTATSTTSAPAVSGSASPPAPPTPAIGVRAGSTPALSPFASIAAQAIAQLDAIESMLNLDIVIPPNDKHQINALNRVSDAAIGLASDIVSAAPDRFPDFADLPAAASYVQMIGQVASRASELATHIQKSVQNQRAPAAVKTLALYAVVKGLGRITDNETMREKVGALKEAVAPRRANPKPKETKGEKAVKRLAKATSKRVAKALQTLAAAGVPVPPTPPATATSVPPAPSAAPTLSTSAPAPTNGASPPPAASPANGAASPTPTAAH